LPDASGLWDSAADALAGKLGAGSIVGAAEAETEEDRFCAFRLRASKMFLGLTITRIR
jgi:hypothetical protein